MMNKFTIIALFSLFIGGCAAPRANVTEQLLDPARYDTLIDGKPVKLFTLSNDNISVQLTNYGGRMLTILVPDRDGVMRNINWREPSITDIIESPYLYPGAIIGRTANLSGNGGVITIDGVDYQLSVDPNNNHYAGGTTGMSFCVWDYKQGVNKDGEPYVALKYLSEDGHEGYPGNLNVTATYTLKSDALELTLDATTDAPTYVNLTHHPFFNLHGSVLESTNSHQLKINADNYAPASDQGPLSGEIVSVDNSPFDFRCVHTIGKRINEDHPQLTRRDGYDVHYMINEGGGDSLVLAAEMYEPANGVGVRVYSNQTGMQLFGGPFQGAKTYANRASDPRPLRFGVGLECQNAPNAINCKNFPSAILRPGEVYHKVIKYQFFEL